MKSKPEKKQKSGSDSSGVDSATNAASRIRKMKKGSKMHGVEKISSDLTSDIVKELGGNESDLELVAGVDDDFEEFMAPADDLEAEPIKRDEIRDFVKSLGFHELFSKDQEKTPRLKERPLTEEEKKDKKRERAIGEKSSTGINVDVNKEKKKDKSNKKNKYDSTDAAEMPVKKDALKKKKKTAGDGDIQSSEVTSTKSQIKNVDFAMNRSARKHLLLKAGAWQQYIVTSDDTSSSESNHDVAWVLKMKDFAETLWKEESNLYKQLEEKHKKGGTSGWLRTVLSSGTSADRLAALTVLVQDSPIHNLSHLDSLLTIAQRKGDRNGCVKCVDTMKELFVSELLLQDRKLRSFEQCLPTMEELQEMSSEERDRKLILCYFESQLKEKYSQFISSVDKLSHDTVEAVKKKAIGVVYELLAERPEQEKKLLSMLVNKLGDPKYRVAANTCHLLTKLVTKHPNMKLVIVDEVERLLYRSNISDKAQYYAVCFLNQLLLSRSESALASKLLTLYFSFFQVYVRKGDIDSKMLSALLTGVNRAYPFVKGDKDKLISQADTLYRVCHMANFNVSVQALMLLSHVIDFSTSDSMVDRYFSALYRKLLDPALLSASKLSWFLNLLYKSLKQDLVERRIQAFIKRLLQVCAHFTPSFICASLVLLSELLKNRPGLLALYNHVQEHGTVLDNDDDEEHFVDISDTEEQSESLMQCNGHDSVEIEPKQNQASKAGSWVHRDNVQKKLLEYDSMNRNPQYCRAELECTWELLSLARHSHPTVSLFAQKLLKGEAIQYDGDPLQDFTLIRFLDRFVFRNPKKSKKEDVEICESAGAKKLIEKSVEVTPIMAANSDEYLLQDKSDVPAHENYLYRYFTTRANTNVSKKKKQDDTNEEMDSDAESVEDDEFDTFLDKFEKGLEDNQFDVDFASGFKDKSKKKKKKKSDDDDDDEADLSDEEINFDDDEDFKAAFEDDDDDVMEDTDDEMDADNDDFTGDVTFDGDDDDDIDDDDNDDDMEDDDELHSEINSDEIDSDIDEFQKKTGKQSKKIQKHQLPKAKLHQKSKFDASKSTGLFADADEFSEMLQSNAGLNMISSDAVSRKDRAGVKQLKWEADRERWMEDRHWKQKKSNKNKGKMSRVKGGRISKSTNSSKTNKTKKFKKK